MSLRSLSVDFDFCARRQMARYAMDPMLAEAPAFKGKVIDLKLKMSKKA